MSASPSADAPVMIMVAPNGARALKKDNPATPITPREIAEDVIRCAGASIAHIHARAPDGEPTQSIEVFREIVERIREKSDIVLQISLGTPRVHDRAGGRAGGAQARDGVAAARSLPDRRCGGA
jgi:uncharacterized protein (DUF849 family)